VESSEELWELCGRCSIEITDHRHRRLLRSRRQRPCNYRAAKKPDEFPPPHGIYSLAENHLSESLIRSSSESYAPHRSKIGGGLMSALCQKQTLCGAAIGNRSLLGKADMDNLDFYVWA
jgi:hypothetical protein